RPASGNRIRATRKERVNMVCSRSVLRLFRNWAPAEARVVHSPRMGVSTRGASGPPSVRRTASRSLCGKRSSAGQCGRARLYGQPVLGGLAADPLHEPADLAVGDAELGGDLDVGVVLHAHLDDLPVLRALLVEEVFQLVEKEVGLLGSRLGVEDLTKAVL